MKKLLSYFKKLPEKDMTIEVIVEFTDNNEIQGSIIDVIPHPLDYIPEIIKEDK